MTSRSDSLLSAQDGPIVNGNRLQDRVQPFTLPILRFKDTPEPADCGSGVLVKIGAIPFILTAGHCVQNEDGFDSIVLGVRNRPHRYEFMPVRSNFVCHSRVDFGYYEISKETASYIEAGNRSFLNELSLEVLPVPGHEASRDFLVLGGYPLQLMQNFGDGTGARLLVYSTTMSNGKHAPPSNLKPAAQSERREIHVWIPQQGNVDTLARSPTPTTLCRFPGASGGGWWNTHMTGSDWKPVDVKLIGTHVGSGSEFESADGLRHRFSRVSLIGNHLSLIGRDYPHLMEHIRTTWPNILGYEVDFDCLIEPEETSSQ